MIPFFRYNWIVREQWYQWCEELPNEELIKERTGGMGSILKTLFHIADVEWSWIRVLKGLPDFEEPFENHGTLAKVRELDARFRPEVEVFVNGWDESMETRPLRNSRQDGSVEVLAWGRSFATSSRMRSTISASCPSGRESSAWRRSRRTLFAKG